MWCMIVGLFGFIALGLYFLVNLLDYFVIVGILRVVAGCLIAVYIVGLMCLLRF